MPTTVSAGASVSPGGIKGPVSAGVIEIGAILDFGGLAAPAGWLLCFGQLVSRTTHALLFQAIGTAWGAGDGASTFAVPDLRGRALAGLDNMGGTNADRLWPAQPESVNGRVLGAAGGEERHTLTLAQLPQHQHNDLGLNNTTGNYWNMPAGGLVQNLSFSTTTAGGGGSHNNTQPSAVVTKIIFAGV